MSNLLSDPKPAPDVSNAAYEALGDIELTISAELDRRSISVMDLLRLRIDDVLAFSRPTGENVDLFAGNVLIGSAEILAINDRLAVRVAELVDRPPIPLTQAADSKKTGKTSPVEINANEL